MAQWLDTVFYELDYAILAAIHAFAVATGGALSRLLEAITHLADDGLGMIALGLMLLLFKRTRKMGVAVLAAIAFGAAITNLTLKPLVMRARPYTHEEFRVWWEVMGAHVESDRSFPSGHTTSAMAAMMGIFLTGNKRYSWSALLFALLMGFTRMYFVVHYPTDVLGGLVAGALGGAIGFLFTVLLWRFLQKHKERRLFRLVLELDPIVWGVKRLRTKKAPEAEQKNEAFAPCNDHGRED